MAVARDAVSETADFTADHVHAHTPAGTPAGVLVIVFQNGAAGDEIAGITYGGVALAREPASIGTDTNVELMRAETWFLGSGLPTGTQNVAIDVTGATPKRAFVITLTAADNTEVEAAGSDSESQDDPSVALSTSTDTYVAAGLISGFGTLADITAGSGFTLRGDHDFGQQVCVIEDGTDAGGGVTVGFTTSAAEDVAMTAIAIREAAPSGTEHFGAFALDVPVAIAVAGIQGAKGAVELDVPVAIAVAGIRNAKGAIELPLVFTIDTDGIVGGGAVEHFGAFALDVPVAIATAGKQVAKGAIAVPLTVAIATAGRRVATGALAVPLTVAIAVAGKRNAKGAIELPLVLRIRTAGRILRPSPIARVVIAGTDVDLVDVFASVTIRHGRGSADDGPLASVASLSLVNVTRELTSAFRVADELALYLAEDVPRFVGRITDADFHDGTLSLLGVSSLSWLSRRPVGLVDYPEELWSARVRRAFVDAGALTAWSAIAGTWADQTATWEGIETRFAVEVGELDPLVAARPAERTTLGQYVADLVITHPAAIAQLPDGSVLVQELTARKARPTIELDPFEVAAYPEWSQVDEVTNRVTVEWAGGEAVDSDPLSIARFEERADSISTELAVEEDAEDRATRDVQRRAWPRWELGRTELLALHQELTIGDPIAIPEQEPAAPAATYLGILEGWEDHVEQGSAIEDGERVELLEWRMILNLSPPRYSGIGVAWVAFPDSETWADAGSATWLEPELALDD